MRQFFPSNFVIPLPRGDARPSPALYQFRLSGALEREAKGSDILVRFIKLSSRSRFSAAFQEPQRRRLRIND
jgi:hypothetical protein